MEVPLLTGTLREKFEKSSAEKSIYLTSQATEKHEHQLYANVLKFRIQRRIGLSLMSGLIEKVEPTITTLR